MKGLRSFVVTVAAFAATIYAAPFNSKSRHGKGLGRRQSNSSTTVDLGYSIYEGFTDATTSITSWLGMRYAASPGGSNRWQPPQPPAIDRDQTYQANAFPQRCPQSPNAPGSVGYNFMGTEDCLFLSVQAPRGATGLPVLVVIHGGGYGTGQGNQDVTEIMNTNNNSFLAVVIQYRLGAFGFLSSDDVYRFGTPNAGILDQHFSLQWVQDYIHLFGGDPTKVTISGESAGGGSVMLQSMAYGGTIGTSLFRGSIAASPYLPMQYGYADDVPSQSYYALAEQVGCFTGKPFENGTETVFECLVATDSVTLQAASCNISESAPFGTWAFLPVTDGKFITERPSVQLLASKVNGERALVGNNANEGPGFTPQDITTEADFIAYVKTTFPLFTDDDVAEVLHYYPSTNASVEPSTPLYATSGDSGATALNESTFGTGQQQRADNLYGETTFVCPSYWLAEAYTTSGQLSYKYQHSVIGAQHGADTAGYFGPRPDNFGPDFELAFMSIWGNFVVSQDPSISSSVANGASSNSTAANPAASWPPFSFASPYQINLNETGGTPFQAGGAFPGEVITLYGGPTLRNDITLVDAWTWEGGRGERCEFWRRVGAAVPE